MRYSRSGLAGHPHLEPAAEPGAEGDPVQAALLPSWKFLVDSAFNVFIDKGREYIAASEQVLNDESKRLGIQYNEEDSFATSLSNYLYRVVGFTANPEEETIANPSGFALWRLAVSNLKAHVNFSVLSDHLEQAKINLSIGQKTVSQALILQGLLILGLIIWVTATWTWRQIQKKRKGRQEKKAQRERVRLEGLRLSDNQNLINQIEVLVDSRLDGKVTRPQRHYEMSVLPPRSGANKW